MGRFTATELHACAVRELAMRCAVYPKFISSGRMTQEKADREILLMGEIVDHFGDLLPPPAQGSFLPDDS
jgi:hypothetical protein